MSSDTDLSANRNAAQAAAAKVHPIVAEVLNRADSNHSLAIDLLNRVVRVALPANQTNLDETLSLEASMSISNEFLNRIRDEIHANELETNILVQRCQDSRDAVKTATRELQRQEHALLDLMLSSNTDPMAAASNLATANAAATSRQRRRESRRATRNVSAMRLRAPYKVNTFVAELPGSDSNGQRRPIIPVGRGNVLFHNNCLMM